ncbi:MAG: alpha/beta fold hydrolase [Actinomycetota bacterium]|jgi:pimeloyl-ACP methyl ester carboxylesterase|nr:alpha/beta fold hydrolase [Actinomycetota bacterium]MDA8278937.1 alpha/beta fold hydrolase [Actinomycetota bacterium]
MAWNVKVRGEGRPLVLVHGIASSLHIWNPLLPRLAAERRVITVDLPGHGATAPEPNPAQRLVPAMAARLVEEVRGVGVEAPFDVVGNSLGGWTALEVARIGAARSVVGLSPAGLWPGAGPSSIRRHFTVLRRTGRAVPGLAHRILNHPVGRTIALWTLFGRPWQVPADEATVAFDGFVGCAGFTDLLAQLSPFHFEGGAAIGVPVTVAFGTRDFLLLPRTARHRAELPPQTRWVDLPGCGHVPTWDDPERVAQVILDGTA